MDLLFLKRLDTAHWLGLRMPPDLRIAAGATNSNVAPEKPWTLDAPPDLEWAGAVYYGPAALESGGEISLGWEKRPKERFAGPAFEGVLADVKAMTESEARKDVESQLAEARAKAGVSLPLRSYRAYVQTHGGSTRSLEAWRDVLLAALSERPGELPVEAFGGLLFLVEANSEPMPRDGVFVDAAEPLKAAPAELQVKAFQHSKGIAFECCGAVGGEAYTNSSVLDAIDGKPHSGYYRITRMLGVVERPSRRSGMVAIPTSVEDAPGWKDAVPGMPAKQLWAERRFRLSDGLAPDELIGELLNYRIELFNPHGRVVRAGRVMLQRQRLDPPAAITRAMARLVAKTGGDDPAMALRFDLPPTEEPSGAGLDVVLYRLENPVLPTGFYGDADDAAVHVARLLSDIDPAALMDVRAGDQVLSGASSESAQANLSNHGLEFFASFSLQSPAALRLPALRPSDDSVWSQFGWEVSVKQLDRLLPPGSAVRLMLALRRVVATNSVGAVFDGPVPESPVLEPQMLLGFDTADTERDQVVPHFERFWTQPVEPGLLDADRVFLSEADMPGDTPPQNEADNRARVRLQVQHLATGAAPGPEPIGGYRVWMRDLPARHAQGVAFEALATVQAVPQLVKAYAPIEVGRQWWVEAASDRIGDASAVPSKETFLASPSPHAIIRNKEEVGPTAAQVVDQLNALVKDVREGKARRHDVRGGALLLQFWRLLDQGLCSEVILSVAQRRELTRAGARAWLDSQPGNWIVFRDQNGGYLGRAWTFSGAEAARLARVHVLNEVPNTEDTVAVDDFGQVTWNWEGLQDAWHHELEWVVEPLSRYAPLRRRSLPPASRPAAKPRHPVPLWQEGKPGDDVPEANIHRLPILRRMPLTARVGLIPVPDAEEDAFVWKVNLPPEFRRATHNTRARTALGALRLEVLEASAKTMLAADFEKTAVTDLLIARWCGGPQPEPAPEPETLESLEEGHQLVIHQAACFQVTLKVRPRADTMPGVATPPEPPPGEGSLLKSVERVAKAFTNEEMIQLDHCRTHEDGAELVVPVARLGWSYTGKSRPTVEDVIGRRPDTSKLASMPGLRLPDPAASMTVLIRDDDDVLRPCAYFFGPAVIRDKKPPLPPGWAEEVSSNVRWGIAYRYGEVVTNITLSNGGPHPGDLVLALEGKPAARMRILWKRGGSATELPPPTPL